MRSGRRAGERVPAADAFFLYVDSPTAPQHVGGMVIMDDPDPAGYRDRLAADLRAHLDRLPRFRQLLVPPGRWRRARWVAGPEPDWAWHVPAVDVTGSDGRPGGEAGVRALVADLAGTPLPRDRPLWRFLAVTGVGPGRVAAVLVVHHVVADGVGTVAQIMRMLRPPVPPPGVDRAAPGRLRVAAGTALGIAQLATDGTPSYRLPGRASARRGFGTVELPLADVREVARRHRARVTDVLLCAVAGGLRRVLPDPPPAGTRLRVAVPLMVRAPGASGEGNVTAAVMMDLPLGPLGEARRLAGIARSSARLRTGTRALASRFVMRWLGEALPPALHGWFARTVYGRRFFQAIVSNMPGPQVELCMAGGRMRRVYPILPLGPGAPLAVGALGWHGTLCAGLAVDPAAIPSVDALADAVRAVFSELRAPPGRSPSSGPG